MPTLGRHGKGTELGGGGQETGDRYASLYELGHLLSSLNSVAILGTERGHASLSFHASDPFLEANSSRSKSGAWGPPEMRSHTYGGIPSIEVVACGVQEPGTSMNMTCTPR